MAELLIYPRALTEEESDDWHTVGVYPCNGAVMVEIGNGGDFGPTTWELTPDEAVKLAETLVGAIR